LREEDETEGASDLQLGANSPRPTSPTNQEDETKGASELQLGANSPRPTSPTNEEPVVHPLQRNPVSTKVKHSRILRRNSAPGLRDVLLRLDPATLARARISFNASKEINSPSQE
jgi:hypothetical protein